MFDVQVIDNGINCILMCNEHMVESNRMNLHTFYREEMIMVYQNKNPNIIIVLDKKDEKPILKMKTDYLALSPNFFNKGYALYCEDKHVMDLDLKVFVKEFGTFPKEFMH